MKKVMRTALKPLDWIMQVIAAILKLFGLGGGSGTGRSMLPHAPETGKRDIEAASVGEDRGLSPERKLAMSTAIVAFALADRDTREIVNLSALPVFERAYLMACDEETLARIGRMDSDKALDFVLARTTAARRRFVKPARGANIPEPKADVRHGFSGPVMSEAFKMA